MMVALGVVGDRSEFGVEGSGIIRRVGSAVTHVKVGDAVIVVGDGLLCTRKIVAGERCFSLPNVIGLADAATIACVYGTVILSLIQIGRLQKGQSVLIHCGCGGVGLAAIQVCQMLGAEVQGYLTNLSTKLVANVSRYLPLLGMMKKCGILWTRLASPEIGSSALEIRLSYKA
jgi:D-arabinose 1-dehydrogenase-like Zn-dependent alcohol dehydrogenase